MENLRAYAWMGLPHPDGQKCSFMKKKQSNENQLGVAAMNVR